MTTTERRVVYGVARGQRLTLTDEEKEQLKQRLFHPQDTTSTPHMTLYADITAYQRLTDSPPDPAA